MKKLAKLSEGIEEVLFTLGKLPIFPVREFLQSFISNFISVWGGAWLVHESLDFLSGGSIKIMEELKSPPIFLVMLAVIALYNFIRYRKRLSKEKRVKGGDSYIQIKVTDIFREKGTLVVPTNTSFDFLHGGRDLDSSSVEGQFIKRHFKGDTREAHGYIRETQSQFFQDGHIRDTERFVGKVVPLSVKDKQFFFLATTHLNQQTGTADPQEEDVESALQKLWEYARSEGSIDHLVVPIINTKFGRHSRMREDVIEIIISTFLAACAEGSFCRRLTIVVYHNDLEVVNLEKVFDFLHCKLEVTEVNKASRFLQGSPSSVQVLGGSISTQGRR